MTIKEIIEQYLKDNGFDGLCNSGGCSCVFADLVRCEFFSMDCKPAYKVKCKKCGETIYYSTKKEDPDDCWECRE